MGLMKIFLIELAEEEPDIQKVASLQCSLGGDSARSTYYIKNSKSTSRKKSKKIN
jgi:hypothetical protein